MNKPFSKKIITAFNLIVLVTALLLTAFFGYNEHIYTNIEKSFAEENYVLCEKYAESISENYKDVRKIKSFLQLLSAFDEEDERCLERTLPLLKEFKGFQSEDINYFYNELYIKVEKRLYEKEIVAKNPVPDVTQTVTEPTTRANLPDEVYYVQSGAVYHLYRDCYTLSESSNVMTGKIPEGRRVCKICDNR